jgi:hypothetical protein
MHDIEDLVVEVSGVEKEFSFIHWTDVHLSECDQRDETLLVKMANRANGFGGDPTGVARELVKTFNALKPDLVTVTGDFLDAPTQANIEIGAEILDSLDSPVCITVGNHEWGFLVEPRDRDYWQPRLQPLSKQPLDWHVQQMHGVNLLFVDDSTYQITPEQLQKTEQLLEDGKPCILFLHIPVAIDSLVPRTVQTWRTPILLGAEGISPDMRTQWGMGDEIEPSTVKFCSLVKSHPQMKAIFAGHLHFDHDDEYRQGCSQYVTPGGFQKRYRKVRIVPMIEGEEGTLSEPKTRQAQ